MDGIRISLEDPALRVGLDPLARQVASRKFGCLRGCKERLGEFHPRKNGTHTHIRCVNYVHTQNMHNSTNGSFTG